MRQLRLVGLAEEGDSLLLESPTGESYRLPLDERVRAACRGDLTRLGQIEIESDNPLRPREIQARVRAGESAEQVAASAGMALDRVLRFAYPVLQERSRVVAQARTAPVRPRGLRAARRPGRGTAGRAGYGRGHAGVGRLAPGGRAVGGPAELAARGQRACRALEPRPRPARTAGGGPGRGAAEREGVPRADDHCGHPAGRGRARGGRADRPAGGGPAAAAGGGPAAAAGGGPAAAARRTGGAAGTDRPPPAATARRPAPDRPRRERTARPGVGPHRRADRTRRRPRARRRGTGPARPAADRRGGADRAGTGRSGGRGRGTGRAGPRGPPPARERRGTAAAGGPGRRGGRRSGGRVADRGRRRDGPAGRRPG